MGLVKGGRFYHGCQGPPPPCPSVAAAALRAAHAGHKVSHHWFSLSCLHESPPAAGETCSTPPLVPPPGATHGAGEVKLYS